MRTNKLAKLLSKRNSTKPKDLHQQTNDVAKKVKMYSRPEKRDGYNPGQDERVYEGYYSEKDIARQEAEHAKKHHPKSIMMDKIADMHKKGKLTPEAKKIAIKQMNKMQESVNFLYENWDEFQTYSEEELFEAMEKHHIAANKAFSHIMKGRPLKKGEFQYTGTKEYPVSPSSYLDPAWAKEHNKYDENGKFIKPKKKGGILSRLLRREEVEEEREINEGLLRSVSRYLGQNHIKAKLKDRIEKQQKPHNDAIDLAGSRIRKIDDLKGVATSKSQVKSLNKLGGEIADNVQPHLKRSSQLGRRQSALKPDKSGNMFMKDWPKTPAQLKYLSGQSKIGNRKPVNPLKEETLDEANKLTRALDKYSGNKFRRILGKAYASNRKAENNSDKGKNRYGDPTKSSDNNYPKSSYKGPKITTGGDEV